MAGKRIWACLALLCWSLAQICVAQHTYQETPEEAAASDLLDRNERIKAGESADALLRANPKSFIGYLIKGTLCAESEGNLPKAYYYLKKAQNIIESGWGENVKEESVRIRHERVLDQLIGVAAEMDRYEEQLELLRLHDRLYAPRYPSTWGWPLMKLGRHEEARRKCYEGMTSDDPYKTLSALNTLSIIEYEMDHPEAAYQLLLKAGNIASLKELDPDATILSNTAEVALALLRFSDAEKLLLEASEHFQYGIYSNPWTQLASIYIRELRLPESVASIREMQVWASNNGPRLAQQSWANRNSLTAALLLECGYAEEALGILERVLNRPDRNGGSSIHSDQSEAAFLLFYRYALKTHREQLKEEASWSPTGQRIVLLYQALLERAKMWRSGRHAAALIMQHDRLQWSIRTTALDSGQIPQWCRLDLAEILGGGVVAAEAAGILRRTDGVVRYEMPFLKLLQGYAALISGHYRSACQLLTEGIDRLPREEVLLRAQAEVLLGSARGKAGEESQSLIHYQRALAKAPGVFRSFDIALPCVITTTGDESAQKAASFFARSPRFRTAKIGFGLRVRSSHSELQAVLTGADGSVLAKVQVARHKDPVETARLLCRELHRAAFAPKVNLSQADIASLEGSNLTGQDVRDRLRDLFMPAEQ
jgi:tetratricopeptide (TPR) repeat protein